MMEQLTGLQGAFTMQKSLPFTLTKTDSFYERLGDWIGDVFYDILPEKGYELRDEQIFMAFQLEKAFKEKKVFLLKLGLELEKHLFICFIQSLMQGTQEAGYYCLCG